MSTKPHLSQIQSTDKDKHPHLLSELLELLDTVEDLDSKSVKGIYNSYADMEGGAVEVGFYKVISDETFKNHPTGYYFDGTNFYIKYGLKDIVDKIGELDDITKDTVELVKPKLNGDKDIIVRPGDTIIKIPLDGEGYEYIGGIVVDGVVVVDTRIEGDELIIEIESAVSSTEIVVTIPGGSIVTKSGKGNNEIKVEIVVEGETPIIVQNPINDTEIDFDGQHELRFKVIYPTPPVVSTVDLDKVHCTQNFDREFDVDTEEIIIKLDLVRGREYKIIFYKGVIEADNTPSNYMECNFNVKAVDEVEPPIDPEDPELPAVGWEYRFTLANAFSEYNLNIDPIFEEDIPDDLDIYGENYRLYYLGYSGTDDPKLVPRIGFDNFPASNPDGGYMYMSGVFIFETASIGNKVYKLVKVVR